MPQVAVSNALSRLCRADASCTAIALAIAHSNELYNYKDLYYTVNRSWALSQRKPRLISPSTSVEKK